MLSQKIKKGSLPASQVKGHVSHKKIGMRLTNAVLTGGGTHEAFASLQNQMCDSVDVSSVPDAITQAQMGLTSAGSDLQVGGHIEELDVGVDAGKVKVKSKKRHKQSSPMVAATQQLEQAGKAEPAKSTFDAKLKNVIIQALGPGTTVEGDAHVEQISQVLRQYVQKLITQQLQIRKAKIVKLVANSGIKLTVDVASLSERIINAILNQYPHIQVNNEELKYQRQLPKKSCGSMSIYSSILGIGLVVGIFYKFWELMSDKNETACDPHIVCFMKAPKRLRFQLKTHNTIHDRVVELSAIRNRFEEANSIFQAISASGGMGKTQLALEYVSQFGDQYDLIAWINGTNFIFEQYVTLGQYLGIKFPEIYSKVDRLEQVKSQLAKYERILIIFDGVSNLEDLQEFQLVRPNNVNHYLVTTCNANVQGYTRQLLDVYDESNALSYLVTHLKNKSKSSETEQKQLVTDLHRHPLALAQAVSFINDDRKSISVQTYRKLLKNSLSATMNYTASLDNYNKTIVTVLMRSLEEAIRKNYLAKRLFSCVFVHHSRIPEAFLTAGFAEYNIKQYQVLDVLGRYSLIMVDSDSENKTFSLNSLSHALLRDLLLSNELKAHGYPEDEDFYIELAAENLIHCWRNARKKIELVNFAIHLRTFFSNVNHTKLPQNSREQLYRVWREVLEEHETLEAHSVVLELQEFMDDRVAELERIEKEYKIQRSLKIEADEQVKKKINVTRIIRNRIYQETEEAYRKEQALENSLDLLSSYDRSCKDMISHSRFLKDDLVNDFPLALTVGMCILGDVEICEKSIHLINLPAWDVTPSWIWGLLTFVDRLYYKLERKCFNEKIEALRSVIERNDNLPMEVYPKEFLSEIRELFDEEFLSRIFFVLQKIAPDKYVQLSQVWGVELVDESDFYKIVRKSDAVRTRLIDLLSRVEDGTSKFQDIASNTEQEIRKLERFQQNLKDEVHKLEDSLLSVELDVYNIREISRNASMVGLAQLKFGRTEEAIQTFRQIIKENDQVEVTPFQAAENKRNLAKALIEVGRFHEARNTLQIDREALLTQNNSDIARDLSMLSEILIKEEAFEKAFIYLNKALKIDMGEHGFLHTTIADDFNRQGDALKGMRRLDEAIACYEKANEIARKTNDSVRHKMIYSYNLEQTKKRLKKSGKSWNFSGMFNTVYDWVMNCFEKNTEVSIGMKNETLSDSMTTVLLMLKNVESLVKRDNLIKYCKVKIKKYKNREDLKFFVYGLEDLIKDMQALKDEEITTPVIKDMRSRYVILKQDFLGTQDNLKSQGVCAMDNLVYQVLFPQQNNQYPVVMALPVVTPSLSTTGVNLVGLLPQ